MPGIYARMRAAQADITKLALPSNLPYLDAARDAIVQVPPEASVLAASNLCPHLTHRRRIDEVPEEGDPAAFAARAARYDAILLDSYPVGLTSTNPQAPAAVEILLASGYRKAVDRQGVVLLLRR